jgi:tetratricopeptide (TPR) repeat protein
LELHLGNEYEILKQEQYEVAEKGIRAALAIDPGLVMRARSHLAVSLFEQHKSAESRREFEIVRKAADEHPGIWYYLGRLDLDEGNYQGAIQNLDKASLRPPSEIWLGGLDSNQDSQIQSLESYQLDDLPAEGRTAGSCSSKEWIRNRTSTFLE